MGKVKKEKQSADDTVGDVSIKEEDTYDDKLKNVSIIAQPMAPKKLTKKCLKLIKKGKSNQSHSLEKRKLICVLMMHLCFHSSIEAEDILAKWVERCAESIEERRNWVGTEIIFNIHLVLNDETKIIKFYSISELFCSPAMFRRLKLCAICRPFVKRKTFRTHTCRVVMI